MRVDRSDAVRKIHDKLENFNVGADNHMVIPRSYHSRAVISLAMGLTYGKQQPTENEVEFLRRFYASTERFDHYTWHPCLRGSRVSLQTDISIARRRLVNIYTRWLLEPLDAHTEKWKPLEIQELELPWRSKQELMFRALKLDDPNWALEKIDDHFCGYDPNNKTISFVKNVEDGERGIRTNMKPGRYLRKYYTTLTDKEVDVIQTDVKRGAMWYATSEIDIVNAYKRGPYSCMQKSTVPLEDHPTRYYSGSDFALACLSVSGSLVARALVYPKKKLYVRIYGSVGHADRLKKELYKDNYVRFSRSDDFVGARLRIFFTKHFEYTFNSPHFDFPFPGMRMENGYFVVTDERQSVYCFRACMPFDCVSCGMSNGVHTRQHIICSHCNADNNSTKRCHWCDRYYPLQYENVLVSLGDRTGACPICSQHSRRIWSIIVDNYKAAPELDAFA